MKRRMFVGAGMRRQRRALAGTPAWAQAKINGDVRFYCGFRAGRHGRPAVPHPGRCGDARDRPEGVVDTKTGAVGLHRQRDRRQCGTGRPDGRTRRNGRDVRVAGDAGPEAADQCRHRPDADRQHCRRLQHAGVRQARAVPHRARADRACEEEPRQAHLRLGRQRHVAASGGRTVQEDGRRQSPARALSRRRTGHPGHGRGQLRHDVRQHAGVPGPDRRRRADPDRLRLAACLAAVSQPAADLAVPAGLRGGELVRACSARRACRPT